MFRRPGESQSQAFMRQMQETQQRNMRGKYWQDQQKQQYKPITRDYTPSQRRQPIPSATIGQVRTEFDVERQGTTGMKIHLAFTVFNAGNRTFAAAAQFFLASGAPLRDFNDKYTAQDGMVWAWALCERKQFYIGPQKIVLFMPYSELHMRSGNHNLGFLASIWDDRGIQLARSGFFSFTLQVG